MGDLLHRRGFSLFPFTGRQQAGPSHRNRPQADNMHTASVDPVDRAHYMLNGNAITPACWWICQHSLLLSTLKTNELDEAIESPVFIILSKKIAPSTFPRLTHHSLCTSRLYISDSLCEEREILSRFCFFLFLGGKLSLFLMISV